MIDPQGTCTSPQGFRAAACAAGIKKSGAPDLMLLACDAGTTAAGVFTKNRCQAAPVRLSKARIAAGTARAILCNSGNANCLTSDGDAVALATTEAAAQTLGIAPAEVLVASTGVIGEALSAAPIEKALPALAAALSAEGGEAAAQAIMTTDTAPKHGALSFSFAGKTACIGAIAKGSGMIHPNMGTMLAFFTTDAQVPAPLLQKALLAATEASFNQVSVDGDMSTNDTVFLLASGASGLEITEGASYDAFLAALSELALALAKKIAADGEGAEHLITCRVSGASSLAEARTLAKAVVSSNLLKCAVHGHDANWGRILSAAGQTGLDFDPSTLEVALLGEDAPVLLFAHGEAQPFDEAEASALFARPEVTICLDWGEGSYEAEAYGCDLSAEYVRINADYRS